jgi:two-component system, response regulator, stage 0 sporulation protein F
MSEKPTLLYVDDEMMNLILFKRLFKDHFTILTSDSGKAGIEVLSAQPEVKAVITDMKMPGMSGIEFVTIAKKQFPNTQFFILTGFECIPEISDAMESGTISKYFSKPLNINDIVTSINNSLK